MHNLIHYYYQNKQKIWKVAIIIAIILGIIYYMNYMVTKNNKTDYSNKVPQTNTSFYNDEEKETYISDKSAMSGEKVTEDEAVKINNSISKFLQYCKNENIEEAYNMLSDECKQNEYNSIEKFKEKYIDLKFSNDDIYDIEKWKQDTYKITISKDILATGSSNNEKQIEYITIVEENSSEKLNINGYIGKNDINKDNTINQIKITAVSKKVYIDYEEYEFKIQNLSNKTIKLDSLENTGTMYLETASRNKYKAYTHELYHDDLEIKSNRSVSITIKYSKSYSSGLNIEKIAFDNLILDYPKYKNEENKDKFQDICQFSIDL